MSFETDLYAELAADADLAALVADRIVPSHQDQPAAPYVVYTPIFNAENYDLDGPTGVSRVRLQVDCYAEDQDTARLIGTAVIAAVPESGWPLHGICINEQDLGLDPGARLVRRMVEFRLFHKSS